MQFLTEITSGWSDYELLDSGNGQRLERWGKYTLIRPDPQAIWQKKFPALWEKIDARFIRTSAERGTWQKKTTIPAYWPLSYGQLKFRIELTSFKHTGLFPEQAVQWDWMMQKIQSARTPVKVLNLFGYTGAATIACAAAGASVVHVDASKPGITWARENTILSGLQDKPVRWIVDDTMKFVAREIRRGNRYEGIIMDPPIYGHGPNGETWDLMRHLPQLVRDCTQLLSPTSLFFIINSYAVSASAYMLGNLMSDFVNKKGVVTVGELALQEQEGKRLLSTGIFARWEVKS